ncbi:MAG: translocation/assembly module TamB domain-containing protein [Persicimonas sp.]
MRKWLKTLGKVLGVIVGLLVVLVLLVVLIVQTGPGREFVKNQALDTINDTLAGEIEAERLGGNMLGSLELHGVVVRDARGNVAARVPTLTADYTLSQLLEGELSVASVAAQRPVVLARLYPDGTLNLATVGPEEPPEQPQPPSEFQVSIEQAAIDGGLVVYLNDPMIAKELPQDQRRRLDAWLEAFADPQQTTEDLRGQITEILEPRTGDQPAAAAVDGLDVRGSFHVYGRGAMSGRLDSLEALVHTTALDEPQELYADKLLFQQSVGHLEARIEEFRVGSLAHLSKLRGAVDFETEQNELGTRVSVGIHQYSMGLDELSVDPQLVTLFAPQAPLTGPVTVGVRAGGTTSEVSFAGRLGCGAASSATVAGRASFRDDELDGARYDVAALLDELQPSRCLDTGDSEIEATGALAVEGRGIDPETLSATARLSLESSRLDTYRLDALHGVVRADEGRFTVESLQAITPYARADAHGAYGLDGDYRVSLDLDANEEIRDLVEQLGQGEMRTEYARVRLRSSGQLDPEADSPLGYLQDGELSLNWQLRNMVLEEQRIGSSRGEISTSVAGAEDREQARGVEFDADADADSLDLSAMSAQTLDLEAAGGGVLRLPVEDPLAALERLSTTFRLRTRGLRVPQGRVGYANLRGGLARPSLDEQDGDEPVAPPFEWSLRGQLGSLRFDQNQLGRADLDLRGTAGVERADQQKVELGRISARGRADLSELATSALGADRASLDVDVSGQVPEVFGSVDLEASGVEAAGEQIESIDARAELTRQGRFAIDGRVMRDVPITLDTAGRVSDEYRYFEFERLDLGTPRIDLALAGGASLRLLDDGVRVDDFRVEAGDQFVLVDGTIRTTGSQDFLVELGDLQPGELREGFGLEEVVPDIRGSITGTLAVAGTAQRPVIGTELIVRDFYYEDNGPFATELLVDYDNERLRIEKLEASAYRTQVLSASGDIPLILGISRDIDIPRTRRLDVQARVPRLALEQFHDAVPALADYQVGGHVMADISLGGTIRNPRIQMQLDAQDMSFAGEVGREYLEIEQLTSAFKVEYSPPRGGRGGIGGRFNLTWRDEEIVVAHVSTPMPIAQWVRQVVDEGQSPPDIRTAIADLPFDLALRLEGLDLGMVPLQTFAEADAEGSVFIDVTGDGTFADPSIDFEVRLDDFGWEQFRHIYVDSRLRLRDQVVHIDELGSEWDGDEVIMASGEFPLPTDALMNGVAPADLPIDLTLQLDEVPISKLGVIDYEFARYEGSVAGFLQADGTLSAPSITGRAGVFDTELAEGERGTLAVSFEAEDGRFDAEGFVCRYYDELLEATASLPVNLDVLELAEGASLLAEGPIRGRVQSERMELAQLVPAQMFEEYISEPGGTLEIDMELAGTWDDPEVSGHFFVQDGAITLPYYGRRFTDIQVDLRATTEQVRLATLSLSEGDSSMEADAVLDMENFSPQRLDATLQTDEFSIGGFAPGVDAYITSETAISGDFTRPVNQLTVRATELDVSVPETGAGELHPTALHDEIVVLQRRADAEEVLDVDDLLETPEEEAARATRYDVRFIAERGSWVRHPSGDVEFRADVSAEIGGPQVSVVGAVDTIRGHFEFLGKRFEVPEQENAILLTGASPPNPQLDVRAIFPLDRNISDEVGAPTEGDPRIIVRVRGRADEPRLVLESDPAMSETEIVYVLMTGRAPNQAGAGEESRISGMALGAASGLFAGMLQQRLASTLPVDVLRVETGEEGFRDARIQFGKYLTENIFISYSYRFGAEEDEGQNLGKIEYRFAPSWKLETQYSDEMTGTFNIFWDIY